MNRGCVSLLLFVWIASLSCVESQEPKRPTPNVCVSDITCPDNAFCKMPQPTDKSGFCACKMGFIINNYNNTHRECLREANYGDPCKMNIQCQSKLTMNSECANGECKCKDGSHFLDGRCYTTSLVGQKCTVSQNCYLGPDDISANQAFCVRGICQCNLLHNPRDGGTRCLKDAMLGDECEDDDQCASPNSRCNNVCRCLDQHVMHPSENRCLKVATSLNEQCEIEAQCTNKLNGTTCVDQKCICAWGNHMLNNRCWVTRLIGQRCKADQECTTEAGDRGNCKNGICICDRCKGANSSTLPKITHIFILINFVIVMFNYN